MSDGPNIIEMIKMVTESCEVGWQPIETAPKDGRPVLATWDHTWVDVGTRYQHIHIEAMSLEDGVWSYVYDGDSPEKPPTHWMPLPHPPHGAA